MADSLPPEQRATYAAIIDDILKHADLEQISAKAIRQAMQERISYDIAPQKTQITEIIMERFDKAQSQAETTTAAPIVPPPVPTANGNHHRTNDAQTAQKRKASSTAPYESDVSDVSDVLDAPAPKKVKKAKSKPESDEAFAAKLQAELIAQDRPTRGGLVQKRRSPYKKEKKTKKKSAAKVGSEADSDMDENESGEVKEKKGAFHKPYSLSEPLATMLGESVLSRPQTVKKIWQYVKEHDLQDPADKRQFICDHHMRAVFKQDRIHMFTMNKLLGSHLYPLDES